MVSTTQDVTTVIKDTLADGKRWFLAVETVDGHSASAYLANRADGVWYWFPNYLGGKTFLAYKYPARPGDTFQSGLDGRTTVTVKDTNASTNTPSGTFRHCYLYESKTDEHTNLTQAWVVPGLGPVAETDLEPFPGGGTYIAMRKGLTTYILH